MLGVGENEEFIKRLTIMLTHTGLYSFINVTKDPNLHRIFKRDLRD